MKVSGKKDAKQLTVRCEKQKDAEEFQAIDLELKTVRIEQNGETVTSCVLTRCKPPKDTAVEKTEPDKKNDKRALQVLAKEWGRGMTHGEWLNACIEEGLARGSFKHYRSRLLDGGWVVMDKDTERYRATEKFQGGSKAPLGRKPAA
jgi:hypothetical protein